MNAAVYNAQVYFDRREGLLRSVAASTVRNVDAAHTARTPASLERSEQVSVTPLPSGKGTYDWALVLTQRGRSNLIDADSAIVYVREVDGITARLLLGGPKSEGPISAESSAWISQTLANQPQKWSENDDPNIIWLRPPMDEEDRMFLFTPLDLAGLDRSWIGLEVDGLAKAISEECASHGGTCTLYDRSNEGIVYGPYPFEDYGASIPDLSHDSFSIKYKNGLPKHLVLIKSLGEDGWTLVYSVHFLDLLEQRAIELWTIIITTLSLLALVIVAVMHVKRKLISPALLNYEALIDSFALNEKIIEVAPVGLCLVSRTNGTVLMCNEAARSLLQGLDTWLQEIRRAEPPKGKFEYTSSTGRSVFLTYAAMNYQNEKVVLCGISDITNQKEIEQTLREAKLAAEKTCEARAMFFATISHEIRTPLYGIMGTLELLGLTALSGQQQQYLNTIQQSSSILLRTINDTLDLSQIEAGGKPLEIIEFSTAETLERVVANFAARACGKGLHLYAVVETNVPHVLIGDAACIMQILNNLVSNAVKFTDAGRVTIRASAIKLDHARVKLRVQVADTGVGVPADAKEKLFEPYFRANTMHDRRVFGTGLGLAICKRLSDLMGGSLSVVSEEGLGTSIALTLPLEMLPEMPPVDLKRRPVYVDGEIREVVSNICQWLNSWGAIAIPFRTDEIRQPSDAAVLVQTWPPVKSPSRWKGRRVRVLAPGSSLNFSATAMSLNEIVCTNNPVSIGRAVSKAQHGIEPARQSQSQLKPASLGLRVMLVEDNVINQLILREQLEHLGCVTTVVCNGREALQLGAVLQQDVILTDLNMPTMGGDELARALRLLGYVNPIIGVTADATPEATRLATEAGINKVLIKPLTMPILAQVLGELSFDWS